MNDARRLVSSSSSSRTPAPNPGLTRRSAPTPPSSTGSLGSSSRSAEGRIGTHNTTTTTNEINLTRPLLDMRFSYLTGVISTAETVQFERMIFRTTRGNCFVKFEPIEHDITDPHSGVAVKKSVFIVFFKSDVIGEKIKRICDAFRAHRYSMPDNTENDDDLTSSINMMLTENAQDIVDSRTVLLKNQDARYRLCARIARHHERWSWIVLREKAIYHSLNMFRKDVAGMLRGEGWVTTDAVPALRLSVEQQHGNILERGMPCHVDRVPQPWPTPPTHFVTNKFTHAYQEFVNTYGIPRYREVNPAVFTAATFPFLFGVMYGDIGHGLFIFVAGLILVWNESKFVHTKMDEMTEFFIVARYMILMMGFFAIYAGLVYNDFFSLGLNLFQSRYVTYGSCFVNSVAGSSRNKFPRNEYIHHNYCLSPVFSLRFFSILCFLLFITVGSLTGRNMDRLPKVRGDLLFCPMYRSSTLLVQIVQGL